MFYETDRLKEIDSQLKEVDASKKATLAKIDGISAKYDKLVAEYISRKDENLLGMQKNLEDRLSFWKSELKDLKETQSRLLDDRKALTNSHLSPQSNQGNNMYLILLPYRYLTSTLTYSICFHINKIGMKKSQGHKSLTWEAEQNLIFNSLQFIAFWPLHLITSSDFGGKKTRRSRSTVTSYSYPSNLTQMAADSTSSPSALLTSEEKFPRLKNKNT